MGSRPAKRDSASAVGTGAKVEVGERLAYINDPLGENNFEVLCPVNGIIIGKTNLPLVFAGEAIFNIASYEEIDQVAENIDAYHEDLDPNTDKLLSDEPPVV